MNEFSVPHPLGSINVCVRLWPAMLQLFSVQPKGWMLELLEKWLQISKNLFKQAQNDSTSVPLTCFY